MILSTTSASTALSGPGAAPSTGTDAASADQGFFGLLLSQAGADVGPEAMLAAEIPAANAASDSGLVPAVASATEPAAPIATTLLLSQPPQPPAPAAPEVPAPTVATQDSVTGSLLGTELSSVAPMIISTEQAGTQASEDEAASTEVEDDQLSDDPDTTGTASALLPPMPAPQPAKVFSTETAPGLGPARDLSASAPTRPAPMAANKPIGSEQVQAAETSAEVGVPALPAHAGSERVKPQQPAFGADGLVAIAASAQADAELSVAEVPAAGTPDRSRNEPDPAARETPTLAAARSAEQPAVTAAITAPNSGAVTLAGDQPQTSPAAASPEAVAAIGDAPQGDAGGLDQFSAGHDGSVGRTQATTQSNAVQADFKSMLATTDMAAEPHRAVHIASVQLHKAAASRNTDALTIQLEPLDLGKIEVRLDFGAEGRVHASIVAEKVDTLDLLQRDSRSLERALQSAGLQTDAGSLNFNLRGEGRSGREFGGRGGKGGTFNLNQHGITEIQIVAARPSMGAAGRVDIRI